MTGVGMGDGISLVVACYSGHDTETPERPQSESAVDGNEARADTTRARIVGGALY